MAEVDPTMGDSKESKSRLEDIKYYTRWIFLMMMRMTIMVVVMRMVIIIMIVHTLLGINQILHYVVLWHIFV